MREKAKRKSDKGSFKRYVPKSENSPKGGGMISAENQKVINSKFGGGVQIFLGLPNVIKLNASVEQKIS